MLLVLLLLLVLTLLLPLLLLLLLVFRDATEVLEMFAADTGPVPCDEDCDEDDDCEDVFDGEFSKESFLPFLLRAVVDGRCSDE